MNKNSLTFWNNEYVFDATSFALEIDKLIDQREYEKDISANHHISSPLSSEDDIENLESLTDEEKEDMNNEGYFCHVYNLQQHVRIASLSNRKKMTKEVKEEIKKIWRKLEANNELIFSTPYLRDLAEKKLKLQTGRPNVDFFITNTPDDVDEELLIKYLSNDIQLLRSSLVIEYINYKKQLYDSDFIKKIAAVILPKGLNQRSQKEPVLRAVADWVFAQIFFYQNIELLEDKNKSDKKALKELTDQIQKEFFRVVGKLPGLKSEAPSEATLLAWFYDTKQKYEEHLSTKELFAILQSHLSLNSSLKL